MNRKDKIALIIALILVCFLGYYYLFPNRNWFGKPYLDENESNAFAVVELFTSEGCSSCPPADYLFAKVEKESQGKNIYLLAFHVDYWDTDNWKDRFSDKKYTQRQYQYSTWMNSNLIYTPQFVVNGISEFGGDDGRKLYGLISDGLKMKQSNTLKLDVQEKEELLLVNYKTSTIKNSNLHVAIVQKKASSNVKGGENSHSVLKHVQIVREFTSLQLNQSSGNINLQKPQFFNNKEWEVMAFVQNKLTGAITAATKAQKNNTN